jgi:hypothetical protein
MAGKARWSWRRTFNRYVPHAAVIIGLILVLSGLAVVDTRIALYSRVIAGVVLVLAGYLYAQHPFLTSERRYTALRGEVENFIDLVRKLNRTAIAIGGGPEYDEVTTAMRECLSRIEKLAGKETE